MPRLSKNRPNPTPAADYDWFSGRARDLGRTLAQVSADITGHKDLLGRALKGSRELKPAELVALSGTLKAPLGVIVKRLGYDVPGATVPLIGRVNQHGRVVFTPPQDRKEIQAPVDSDYELVALVVDAPQSSLGLYNGNYLYYEPAQGFLPGAVGRLSVIELGDYESAVVGVLERGRSVSSGRVILLDGREEIESDQIKSAAPVRWQRAT